MKQNLLSKLENKRHNSLLNQKTHLRPQLTESLYKDESSFDRIAKEVYKIALRFCGGIANLTPMDKEDMIQDAYLAIIENVSKIGEMSPDDFILSVANLLKWTYKKYATSLQSSEIEISERENELSCDFFLGESPNKNTIAVYCEKLSLYLYKKSYSEISSKRRETTLTLITVTIQSLYGMDYERITNETGLTKSTINNYRAKIRKIVPVGNNKTSKRNIKSFSYSLPNYHNYRKVTDEIVTERKKIASRKPYYKVG